MIIKENLKIIGSGINYPIAKELSLRFTRRFQRAFAFDYLENHKHIDMSGEPLLLTLVANISQEDYQEKLNILELIKVPHKIPSESKIISIEDICLPGTKLWWNSSKIAKDIPIRSEP